MNNRLKKITYMIIFVLIFVSIFSYLQTIFRGKFEESEYIGKRTESFKDAAARGEEIDVLFLGSSPVYAGITPMILWEEYGITSMNFGISRAQVVSMYYLLLDLMEYNKPKMVILDFCDIYGERRIDDENYIDIYKRVYYSLNSQEAKIRFLWDAYKTGGMDIAMDFAFPLFDYHHRWEEISGEMFTDIDYEEYRKGAYLYTDVQELEAPTENYYEGSEYTASEFSLKYYNLIVELCKQNNVEVVAVSFPLAKATNDYSAEVIERHYKTKAVIQEFCDDNDIQYIDYRDKSLQDDIQLDFKKDFYNESHINLRGSIKLSKHLGAILQDEYGLNDYRADSLYASWNDDWSQFYNDYGSILAEFGY